MKKNIPLTINGTRIVFAMTPTLYNQYIDEMQMTKKVGPASNLLMRAVQPEDKDALREILALPGACMQIVGELVEQFAPDLEIIAGE